MLTLIALGASLVGNVMQSRPQPDCAPSQVAYYAQSKTNPHWVCAELSDLR